MGHHTPPAKDDHLRPATLLHKFTQFIDGDSAGRTSPAAPGTSGDLDVIYEDGEGGDDRREPLMRTSSLESKSYVVNVIEPGGTLALIVGGDRGVRKLIVSTAVKKLSPRWKDVVARSKREGFRGEKRVRLSDDDADMMLLVMHIAHHLYERVPKTLDFDQLLGIARICNRYDMNSMIIPFVADWMALHQPKILRVGYEQWLYIAHQFGKEADYLRLAKHLAFYCRINAEKQLLVPGTDRVLDGCFPEGCLAAIRHVRVKTLVSFLETMYSQVTRMVDGNSCEAGDTAQSLPETDERTMCTLYNHGFMIRYFKMQGYWPPVPNAGVIEESVLEVAHRLTDIPPIHMPSLRHDSVTSKVASIQSTTPPSQHEACDAGKILKVKIKKLIEATEAPVEAHTLEEMRSNARKFGWET
ncbi:hypothetical protein K458DRAFT_413936 [Lentithecium fluviatile CBS 122367]|uniref:BTB domain-containing protein n=1 Tax=Lentithecium fluviatile CBS 122367 TaxID=1168545 RepID=A0A6G1JHR7_9PLEO|nr:hypothetical protein K458DRAFT_413936 [Lentithecium fluviatile CBS 122367]